MNSVYIFKRQSNKFDDILSDRVIKKNIRVKLRWDEHLLIELNEKISDKLAGYVILKYGDELVENLCKDFSPIPYVDYVPSKDSD